jgi:hypothetical protein
MSAVGDFSRESERAAAMQTNGVHFGVEHRVSVFGIPPNVVAGAAARALAIPAQFDFKKHNSEKGFEERHHQHRH